jgi:hypothetical protein
MHDPLPMIFEMIMISSTPVVLRGWIFIKDKVFYLSHKETLFVNRNAGKVCHNQDSPTITIPREFSCEASLKRPCPGRDAGYTLRLLR